MKNLIAVTLLILLGVMSAPNARAQQLPFFAQYGLKLPDGSVVSGVGTTAGKVAAGTALASEIVRATGAEGINATAISGVITSIANEVTRAQSAEGANTAAIGNETTRATGAEALLAPRASPVFTGTPTAPTAAVGSNTTQLGTTAFTSAAVAAEASIARLAEQANATSIGTERTRALAAEALAFPTASAGAAATRGLGTSVGDPGTGKLEALLPVQTFVATSHAFVPADLYQETRRSNAGVAMTDTFPGASTPGLVNGTMMQVNNVDASATLTVTAGTGTTVNGAGTTTIGPGRSTKWVYDAPNATWRTTMNSLSGLLASQVGVAGGVAAYADSRLAVLTPQMKGTVYADTQRVSDTVSMAAGGTTLTTSNIPWSSADVGKYVVVPEAGPLGTTTGFTGDTPVSSPGHSYLDVPTVTFANAGRMAINMVGRAHLSAQGATLTGSNGAGCPSGSQVATVTGGTGAAAKFNVTVGSGAVTSIDGVATAGDYTVHPRAGQGFLFITITGCTTQPIFNVDLGVSRVEMSGGREVGSGTVVGLGTNAFASTPATLGSPQIGTIPAVGIGSIPVQTLGVGYVAVPSMALTPNVANAKFQAYVTATAVSTSSSFPGAGCTAGTQTFTVVGGTGVPTVIQATVANGAVQSGSASIANPGLYSATPNTTGFLSVTGGGCTTEPNFQVGFSLSPTIDVLVPGVGWSSYDPPTASLTGAFGSTNATLGAPSFAQARTPLSGKVVSVTDAQHVMLDTAATQAVSGTRKITWGHDDGPAIQAALNALGDQQQLYLPPASYGMGYGSASRLTIPDYKRTAIACSSRATTVYALAAMSALLYKDQYDTTATSSRALTLSQCTWDGSDIAQVAANLMQAVDLQVEAPKFMNGAFAQLMVGDPSSTRASYIHGGPIEAGFDSFLVTGAVSLPIHGIVDYTYDSQYDDVLAYNGQFSIYWGQTYGNNWLKHPHLYGYPVPRAYAQYALYLAGGTSVVAPEFDGVNGGAYLYGSGNTILGGQSLFPLASDGYLYSALALTGESGYMASSFGFRVAAGVQQSVVSQFRWSGSKAGSVPSSSCVILDTTLDPTNVIAANVNCNNSLDAGVSHSGVAKSQSVSVPALAAGASGTVSLSITGPQASDRIGASLAAGASLPAGIILTGQQCTTAGAVVLTFTNIGSSTSTAGAASMSVAWEG